jgi:hypothetical protein
MDEDGDGSAPRNAIQELIQLAQDAGEQMPCLCDGSGSQCCKHRLLHYARRYQEEVDRTVAVPMTPPTVRGLIGKTVRAVELVMCSALGDSPASDVLALDFTDGTAVKVSIVANLAELHARGVLDLGHIQDHLFARLVVEPTIALPSSAAGQ